MAAYERATWRTRMCALVRMCARVCKCVCVHVCTSVIRENKHTFKDNVISLIIDTLYIHRIALIYVMCEYLFVLICVGDVASRGASDSRVK